ncbi:MAG: RusA family crossover junction endodeoxyribonuclease [Terriglobia bacterium]
MNYINHTITGVPYGKFKTRGDKAAARRWTETVKEETRALGRVKEACLLKVTFLLPPDKYPDDYPRGPDLDNLLKRFLDALSETIFSDAKGQDSCVVSMTVMKTKVASIAEAGVHFEVMPVAV